MYKRQAHFFRAAFDLLRSQGTLGLIATNTIAQGETRVSGLQWICQNGGSVYAARRRVVWPGVAAVVVSVVHLVRDEWMGSRFIDGQKVDKITAFLFHKGGHEDPLQLIRNDKRAYVGSYVLGMGFTFNDADTSGKATPISEMNRLIKESQKNSEVTVSYTHLTLPTKRIV